MIYRPAPGGEAVSKTVYERVRRLVADTLGVDEAEVTPDADFLDDLNADPNEVAELLLSIEEEFGIRIPEDDAANLRTVRDAVEYVQDLVE
ncbi:MAG: acyl carrier protein [Chloroflexota bacterium]